MQFTLNHVNDSLRAAGFGFLMAIAIGCAPQPSDEAGSADTERPNVLDHMPRTEWAKDTGVWQDIVQSYLASVNFADHYVGQLGQFGKWSGERQLVNVAHENVPKRFENSRFVSSDGLKHMGDGTHFDASSARELGRRYAKAYADILLTMQSAPAPVNAVIEN